MAIPAADLNLTAHVGNGHIRLTGSVVSGATTYQLKRATESGGSYSSVGSPVSVVTYVDSTASLGVPYFYVVSAINADGESDNSTEVTATLVTPTAHYYFVLCGTTIVEKYAVGKDANGDFPNVIDTYIQTEADIYLSASLGDGFINGILYPVSRTARPKLLEERMVYLEAAVNYLLILAGGPPA